MKYLFRPNCRIRLQLGDFKSQFFRAYRKIGVGTTGEESDAVILEGRNIFEFYDLPDSAVLDNTNHRIVDDHGISYKVVWAGVLTGSIVRAVCEQDPTEERVSLADIFLGFDLSHAFGVTPGFGFGSVH